MSQLNLHYMFWLAKSFAKSLGLWGLVGISLVFFSITFYVVKVSEVKESILLAQEELLNQSKKNIEVSNQDKNTMPQNTAEEVAKFYGRFPSVESLPKILAELNSIAKKQGIEIDAGDYKLNTLKSTQVINQRDLTKYEINFPLKGKYSQIRTFITESLQKFPEIALMDLQVVRDGSANPQVEANLIFAVFVKVNK